MSRGVYKITNEFSGESRVLKDELIIGRSKGDWLFADDNVMSQAHCRLSVTKSGNILVEDLNSSNGTFLGANTIKAGSPLAAKKGESLRCGEQIFNIEFKEYYSGLFHFKEQFVGFVFLLAFVSLFAWLPYILLEFFRHFIMELPLKISLSFIGGILLLNFVALYILAQFRMFYSNYVMRISHMFLALILSYGMQVAYIEAINQFYPFKHEYQSKAYKYYCFEKPDKQKCQLFRSQN